MIDTHAHLDMPEFDADRHEVIVRAMNVGVHTMITVGVDLESSAKAIDLAKQYSGIYAAVGFHPQEAGKMEEKDIEKLAELAKNSRVVAIGEIGLDYYRKRTPLDKQLQALKWQLNLARILKLPVIIHSREASSDMLAILKDWCSSPGHRERSGVIHCFNSDKEIARSFVNMGFFIAFGAYIGYPSSKLQDTIGSIPEDRLLLETDCPFLPPQSHRGKRNEPAYLSLTLEAMAKIKNKAPEKIEQVTDMNARYLFNIN